MESIFFIIILIAFFTFIIINNAHEELQEKIHTLKEDYTSNQKALLKNHINYVIKFIDYYYLENKHLKEELRQATIAIDRQANAPTLDQSVLVDDKVEANTVPLSKSPKI